MGDKVQTSNEIRSILIIIALTIKSKDKKYMRHDEDADEDLCVNNLLMARGTAFTHRVPYSDPFRRSSIGNRPTNRLYVSPSFKAAAQKKAAFFVEL